ncbi:MAG: 1-acyl-sn-glycerol-3-phosphate acyltransferase [Lachnospiraceae bacterium]|nr:1-acyl-sn-glycerol-3-phosphate acyltransferase [Lachnospiraceae bacterium]
MIRALMIVISLFCFLGPGFPLLAAQNSLGKKDPHARDVESLKIVQFMLSFLLRISGVKVRVLGKENIPKDTAVLYVGNHRSYYDILVGYTTVAGLTGFVAKKEMLRYPILRAWMKNVNCLFLDRKDLKAAMKTILEGIEKIKNGISIWIFPEGTRNPNEDILDMLPFKEGSLKIAEKSGCPVVPVAIVGTAEIFEKHMPFVRPSQVTIMYGKPFYIKELEPEQRKRSGSYTRQVISDMLRQIQQEEKGEQE